MPYYSELGIYTSPTSSYSGAYIPGPYSNHSSLLASNFMRPPPVLVKPRNFRGYKPLLATITENQSPLRRIRSPKLLVHTSPKVIVARPLKINTADIDVSVNRYRKYERANKQPEERVDRKSESPERPRSSQEKEAKPNKVIRRDRPTVRLNTVHKDKAPSEVTRSWRDNFEPDELYLVDEDKRVKKSPGELLKEKFWIRSREDIFKAPKKIGRRGSKKSAVQKSPSFHDICTAISTNQINEELNPGQPLEIQRRQSRRYSNENIFKELTREDIININSEDIQENGLDDSRGSVKRKKKLTKKKSNEKLVLTPSSPDIDGSNKSMLQRRPTQRKIRRTSTSSSVGSEASDVDVDTEKAYQEAIRDISQVEIENIKVKPKPIITATVDVEETPTLKAVIEDVEVVESPKPKKSNKFKFNVIVEVAEDTNKRKSVKIKKPKFQEQRGVFHAPNPKEVIVSSILKRQHNAHLGEILEDVKEIPKEEVAGLKQSQSKVKFKVEDVQSKQAVGVLQLKDEAKSEPNKIQQVEENEAKSEVNNSIIRQKIAKIFEKTEAEHIDLKPNKIAEKTKRAEVVKSAALETIKQKLEKEAIKNEVKKEVAKFLPKNTSTSEKIQEELKEEAIKSSIKKNEVKTMPENKSKSEDKLVKIQEKPTELSVSNQEKIAANANKPSLKSESEDKSQPRKISEEAKLTTHKIKVQEPSVGSANSNKSTLKNESVDKSQPQKISDAARLITHKIKRVAAKEAQDTNLASPQKVDKNSEKNRINQIETAAEETPQAAKVEEDEQKENEENMWESIGSRESVYKAPRKIQKLDESPKSTDETITQKPMPSKRSLVNKATKDDPDLVVFEPPEPEPEPEPEPPKPAFVPLQTNRLSQFMHPFKKPEHLDECPVEIFATPKVIRHRHYPRPRHPAPQVVQEPESEDESEDEESTESEETSSDDEYDVNVVYGSNKVGASTSSNDSGFDSGVPGSRNKGSTETRESPTSNPANNPALSLDFGESPETYTHSSTFAGFQKSGRITPPATTIPRFRKYTVDDFNFLAVLGKGSFGKVLLAELKDTEYYYAIKCLKKDVVLEDDDVECTLIERKVLALATKHPYLCHLLCTFQTESHLFFVMEYLNGGDLMFHIQKSGRFPEARARFYGAEIVSGLKFLHNKGIVYRDLKLDNILLDFDGHVRIADFGMCKLQIFLDRMADTFCGTPDYMAPEVIKGQHYNQCVDWWSFGVLLYEMLLGQSPFSGCDEDELFWSICNEKPVLPRFLSTEASAVLQLFLEKNANKRLGNRFCPAGDIQDQPFFRPIDWNSLEARLLEAPFKPHLQHPLDTQYFDRTFTAEKAKLTPIEQNILQSMDQTQFQGFSYTNPNATDK